MPTPCPGCGQIVELDDMKSVSYSDELYCENCAFTDNEEVLQN